MKAIVHHGFGPPDSLEFRDIEAPEPGPDNVLIRVRAAGCGPDVWHLVRGLPYMVRLMPGLYKIRSSVPGRDVAGIVEAVGANVSTLSSGDEVMGLARGSFAELSVAPADKTVLKPANMSFEEAAALPIAGLAGLQAIRDLGQVKPEQRVLIVGASGSVGSLALQVAKSFRAQVTGVCSGAKADLVRSLGADDVIDYTREDFTEGTRRWDVLIDTAGRRPLSRLRRALAPKGTLVIVGGEKGGKWTGGFGRAIRAPLVSLFVSQRLLALNEKERLEDLETIRTLVEAGKLKPILDRSFPLAAAPDALRHLEARRSGGKVVISV